jgi:hypothetical protein
MVFKFLLITQPYVWLPFHIQASIGFLMWPNYCRRVCIIFFSLIAIPYFSWTRWFQILYFLYVHSSTTASNPLYIYSKSHIWSLWWNWNTASWHSCLPCLSNPCQRCLTDRTKLLYSRTKNRDLSAMPFILFYYFISDLRSRNLIFFS